MTNKPINTDVLEAFMTRARSAARTGSKEMKLPANEAAELAAAIGQVLARNVALNEQLRATEGLIGQSLRIDGGKFDG